MVRLVSNCLVWAAVAGLVGGCALHAATSGGIAVTETPTPAVAALRFTERERNDIRAYYQSQPKRAQIASAQRSPSGLTRGASLPRQVRGQSLPSELEVRLPRLPQAYARLLVGRDVVLIERNTRKVLDIVFDATP